jgi:RNA polymerase sigma-70 factor, ECF subfamily
MERSEHGEKPQKAADRTLDASMTAAVREGDEPAFARIADRHRRELEVHCYRMLGSLHDSEDAVQETLLRAWRYRESLREDAPLRPWLYRIATNVCLDALARDGRRAALTTSDEGDGVAPGASGEGVAEITWLQPFPDSRLEPEAPREAEPDAVVVTKETIELAFLTVIQLLTPHQRAVLILRDVLGWSARESAELLEVSVASVNSALQRARDTLRTHLPERRPDWPAGVDATSAERELLRRYIEATEQADFAAFESLIREDAVFRMPPQPGTWRGRDTMIQGWIEGGFGSSELGELRCIPTRANRQPAIACYRRREGETVARPLAMDVLRVEEGQITEIITFSGELFEAFGLPGTLA